MDHRQIYWYSQYFEHYWLSNYFLDWFQQYVMNTFEMPLSVQKSTQLLIFERVVAHTNVLCHEGFRTLLALELFDESI